MIKRFIGATTRFTLWFIVLMWINMASHAIPILTKFEDQNNYQWWADMATKIGRPIWNIGATTFAPVFGGFATLLGIEARRGANYLLNSIPQDGGAYIEFLVHLILLAICIIIAPTLWRMLVHLFDRG